MLSNDSWESINSKFPKYPRLMAPVFFLFANIRCIFGEEKVGAAVEVVDEDLAVGEGGGEDDGVVSDGFVGVFGHRLAETPLVAFDAMALEDDLMEDVGLRRETSFDDGLKLW